MTNTVYHYMWNLKNSINKCICKTETESQMYKTNLWLPKRRRKQGGTNQGYGINRYKLLCIKYISNKDTLYGTGNYTHYLVLTYNRIQSAKIQYHCAVHLKLILYCKPTILQLKINKLKKF